MASTGKNSTWIIFNPGGKPGFTQSDVTQYTNMAKKAGINVIIAKNADEITGYINNKTGGDSRSKDKVTDFTYVGHGLPGQLGVDYNGGDDKGSGLDVSGLNSDAFASGSKINLSASCNAATPSPKGSLMSQFANKVDTNSAISGVRGTVDFTTPGADTDSQLLKGGLIRPKGAWGIILHPVRNWPGIGFDPSVPVKMKGKLNF